MKIRWALALGFLGIAAVVTMASSQGVLQKAAMKEREARMTAAMEIGSIKNPSYDGRYTFARIRYTVKPGDRCTSAMPHGPGWYHDYPLADRGLMELTTHITRLDGRADSTVVFMADDPELMKYPIAYLTEPACWRLSDAEIKGLRTYLLKGGFLIVDDFHERDGGREKLIRSRQIFEQQIRLVIPEGKIVPIAESDPVFNNIFELRPHNLFPQLAPGMNGEFYGIYEDNDPSKRLLVIANYNNDINAYWHRVAKGFKPVESTNTAYKIGINYLIYGFVY